MRKPIRSLVLAAGLCTPAAALAQPTVEADLGTLTPGTPVVISTGGTAANQVKWWKFTLADTVRYQDLKFLEIFTSEHLSTTGDPEIGLYNATGVRIASDDDDGPSFGSSLTFGTGDSTWPAGATPAVRNGRDGDLPAGEYYIGISRWSGTPNATGWSWTAGTSAGEATDITISLDEITESSPASFTDLGDLSGFGTATATEAIAANQVKWFRVVLPAVSNALGNYVDMDTEGSTVSGLATRLTMYGPGGAVLCVSTAGSNTLLSDATDGSGNLSQLTFGLTAPTRPAVGTGLAYNGRDGALRAGVYYAAVAGPGTVPSLTGVTGASFGHTSASATSGNVTLNISAVQPTTNPSGTGTSTPATIGVGGSSAVRVTVIPGNNPVSTGLAVTLDTSLVDGGGIISLLDDGNPPDVSANDNIFSANVTAGPFANLALNALPFTITDAQARVGNGTVNLTVSGPTNPTGTSTVAPTFGSVGQSSTVSVLVTNGQFPTSTGVGVSLDATSIDGGTVVLLDDGNPPDVTLGDNRFTGTVTVGAGAGLGAQTMVATITDAQSRSNTVNANFTVLGPAPSCPTADETFAFTNLDSELGAGNAANGVGTFSPTAVDNVVGLRITGRFIPNTSFTAEARIRITFPNLTFIDVQPFTTSGPSGVPVDYTSADIVLPCGGLPTTGTWEVRCWESVGDAAVPDGVWANLCVGLVYGPPSGDPLVWQGDNCVGDAGDLPGTAQVLTGSGPVNSIVGNFTASDVDMYKIGICDYVNFSASTLNPPTTTTGDTKLMLFNLDGTGVMHNDDDPNPTSSSLLSLLNNSGGLLTANGDYYLAIVRYNRTAVDAASQAIWHVGTPFDVIIAPDGPGAANPIAGWINTTSTTGAYTIALTGACYPGGGGGCDPGCNIADITESGGTLEEPGCPDGQLTLDDILVFIDAYNDATGCPGSAPCNLADITESGGTFEEPGSPDGQLTLDDILVFIDAYNDATGC